MEQHRTSLENLEAIMQRELEDKKLEILEVRFYYVIGQWAYIIGSDCYKLVIISDCYLTSGRQSEMDCNKSLYYISLFNAHRHLL